MILDHQSILIDPMKYFRSLLDKNDETMLMELFKEFTAEYTKTIYINLIKWDKLTESTTIVIFMYCANMCLDEEDVRNIILSTQQYMESMYRAFVRNHISLSKTVEYIHHIYMGLKINIELYMDDITDNMIIEGYEYNISDFVRTLPFNQTQLNRLKAYGIQISEEFVENKQINDITYKLNRYTHANLYESKIMINKLSDILTKGQKITFENIIHLRNKCFYGKNMCSMYYAIDNCVYNEHAKPLPDKLYQAYKNNDMRTILTTPHIPDYNCILKGVQNQDYTLYMLLKFEPNNTINTCYKPNIYTIKKLTIKKENYNVKSLETYRTDFVNEIAHKLEYCTDDYDKLFDDRKYNYISADNRFVKKIVPQSDYRTLYVLENFLEYYYSEK